jgi:hypothetical protein
MSNELTNSTLAAVGIGIVFVLVVFIPSAIVIFKTNAATDIELVKARFAQVMFVGIITTFIFTSILYFMSPSNGVGKEIFDKAVTAMTPLAGVIIGYLFSGKATAPKADQPKGPDVGK